MTTQTQAVDANRALLLRAIARSGLSKRQFAKRVLRLAPRTLYRMVAGKIGVGADRRAELGAYLARALGVDVGS